MKPRPLWRVMVTTSREGEEAVSEWLTRITGGAVASYTDLEKDLVFVTAFLETRPSQIESWKRLFSEEKRKMEQVGLEVGPGRLSCSRVSAQDWAESWKRHFKPLLVGGELLVKPSWSRQTAERGMATLTLDPGLSFGTGQHPTTGFCLRELTRVPSRQRRLGFLDIGTGSGILALAAAKLGFAPIEAFDFDPEAVRIAMANARLNRVRSIRFSRQDLTQLKTRSTVRFGTICANVTADVLIEARDRILGRLAPGGVLVLAGILDGEFVKVQRAYEEAEAHLQTSRKEKEWRSGKFVTAGRES